MQIHINKINTPNNNLTFQRRPIYSELKSVPNIHCACCDKKLINTNQLGKAFDAVSRPLKEMLEKGFFEPWKKFEKCWNILMDLAENNPKLPLGKIMEDKDARTTLKLSIKETIKVKPEKSFYENNEYIDGKVADFYTDLMRRSRSLLYSAGTVMKRLAPFKECLNGSKKETFEQLEIYAKKYPRKTITEIINMEEIYKFHSAKDILQRAESREKLDFHFGNIIDMVKKENPKAIEKFEALKDYALNLFEIENDPFARMHIIKKAYTKSLQEYGCSKLVDKVLAEIDQTPLTFVTKDSFLAYAHRHDFNDSNILYSILIPSVASFEHIVPSSEYGSNQSSNGIVFCRECNRWRSDTPYEEFIQYHPRMPINTQKQIKVISDHILKGNMDDSFKVWPIEVAKTLHSYSNGTINIDVSDYAKKAVKQSNKKLEENFATIQNLRIERKEKIKEKENTQQKINEIDKEISNLKNETNSLYDKYIEERKRNDLLSSFLNDKK